MKPLKQSVNILVFGIVALILLFLGLAVSAPLSQSVNWGTILVQTNQLATHGLSEPHINPFFSLTPTPTWTFGVGSFPISATADAFPTAEGFLSTYDVPEFGLFASTQTMLPFFPDSPLTTDLPFVFFDEIHPANTPTPDWIYWGAATEPDWVNLDTTSQDELDNQQNSDTVGIVFFSAVGFVPDYDSQTESRLDLTDAISNLPMLEIVLISATSDSDEMEETHFDAEATTEIATQDDANTVTETTTEDITTSTADDATTELETTTEQDLPLGFSWGGTEFTYYPADDENEDGEWVPNMPSENVFSVTNPYDKPVTVQISASSVEGSGVIAYVLDRAGNAVSGMDIPVPAQSTLLFSVSLHGKPAFDGVLGSITVLRVES